MLAGPDGPLEVSMPRHRGASPRLRAALVAALACVGFSAPALALGEARDELVVSGLEFPLFVSAPAGDPRLFVVERAGRIRIVLSGILAPTPFLDIGAQVSTNSERGLLGLAFAPDYAASGLFYVYYTDLAGDSVISRFSVSPDPNLADPGEEVILTIPQPFANHNGGTIAFGADGMLYFGAGDGGGGNDPAERAQDPQELLGKMLRIDVGPDFAGGSLVVPGEVYRIPADNPFVGDPGTRDEIWAFGLRNPYRFSFDRETGDLWIGDVGQTMVEEVDFEAASDPGGRNYGWDVMEGSTCNPTDPAPAPPCNDPSLTLPVHEYLHGSGHCSITGGNVYRAELSPLYGLYFFGDFCSGAVWSYDPASAELDAAGSFGLVGFGEDGAGGLYMVKSDGSVHRVRPADPACADGVDNDGDGLTDHPQDPGCRDAASDDEAPACNDGVDNDGDGDIDLADSGCQGNAWGNREKRKKSCGLGAELSLLVAVLALRRRTARAP